MHYWYRPWRMNRQFFFRAKRTALKIQFFSFSKNSKGSRNLPDIRIFFKDNSLGFRNRVRMIRRQSFAPSLITGAGEPQIIVEESGLGEEEAERRRNESPPRCLDPDSPSLDPYLLSPWRDTRKHSLPTPQCTSGITASQVSLFCLFFCWILLIFVNSC